MTFLNSATRNKYYFQSLNILRIYAGRTTGKTLSLNTIDCHSQQYFVLLRMFSLLKNNSIFYSDILRSDF